MILFGSAAVGDMDEGSDIDVENFRKKSELGGVFFVAKREGRVIFGEMP
jgi:predicted nucleotidyltransferase